MIQNMTWEQMSVLDIFCVFKDLPYMEIDGLQEYHETAAKRAKESAKRKSRRGRKKVKSAKLCEKEGEQGEQSSHGEQSP